MTKLCQRKIIHQVYKICCIHLIKQLETGTQYITLAEYIAHKTIKYCNGCCQEYLVDQGNTPQHNNYLSKLSRDGLLVPSEGFSVFMSQGFAL